MFCVCPFVRAEYCFRSNRIELNQNRTTHRDPPIVVIIIDEAQKVAGQEWVAFSREVLMVSGEESRACSPVRTFFVLISNPGFAYHRSSNSLVSHYARNIMKETFKHTERSALPESMYQLTADSIISEQLGVEKVDWLVRSFRTSVIDHFNFWVCSWEI